MTYRGEMCRILDKYKSGKWDRDKSALALEKYLKKHQVELLERLLESKSKAESDKNWLVIPTSVITEELRRLE